MKIIGLVEVNLPFALEYCAEGPSVDAICARIDGIDVSLAFPPSMGEKTDGRAFFASGWAWWSGSLLSIELSRAATEADSDFDVIRGKFEHVADELLRRFLNAYRVRFHKPDIHPVRIDAKKLVLEVEHADGSRTAFPESASAYFYNALPADPPLSASINATTLDRLTADIEEGDAAVALTRQLELDIVWLDSIGESARAAKLRSLL